MARFGYARVSTREQNPDHQVDALHAAGVAAGDVFVDKASGKLASRPQLDALLAKLRDGDQVVVTRLKRIGRSQQHLLQLVSWFGEHGVDFIVLEQGIDTSTPGGRLVFHFLAALAEYDREMIVEGTLDGLASARARGRVGGRPAKLSQRQLDQAQHMYDTGQHTAEEIAATFGVSRGTLYRHLSAHKDGGDVALIVYRNTSKKIDGSNRQYGETGRGEKAQLEADSKWWSIAPTRRRRLKAIAYVSDGTVVRVRAVKPDASWPWAEDDRGYVDVPLTKPLTELQLAKRLPTLDIRPGDDRPHVRGKIREYVAL